MSPQPDVALSRCGQDGLPKEFHPAVVLDNTWGSSQPEMGTGLVNLGNTCFLNAVLQCLVGTPTIMNLIASPYSHSNIISRHNLEEDSYKTFEASLLKMINSQGKSLRPTPFTKYVGQVIKSHRPGEQEDAHEYLVNLLEKLHTHAMEAYAKIHGFKFEKQWARTHRHLELTSSINQIFAGIIRSQVLCKNCGSASNTYDPFTDLSLELQDCQRVSDCLHQFTKPEYLGLSNAYLCGKCKRKSEASKQLTLHALPNILVLQLKRFSFMGMQGSKISTHIAYDFEIDMGRYLSRKVPSGDKACIYDLYAVLVHRGSSAHCGHYYAYVKHKGNRWFKLDDSQVN
jgi:ubiquitin carboxyl-terminal hydrolase 36/42